MRKMAASSHSRSKMPTRMQLDLNLKQKTEIKQEEYSFRPKIGELITAQMFEEKQKRFHDKLQRQKSLSAVTVPKSPNFVKLKPKK